MHQRASAQRAYAKRRMSASPQNVGPLQKFGEAHGVKLEPVTEKLVNPVRIIGMPLMAWLGFAASLLLAGICLILVGPTLGLFFGGLGLATTLLPAMSLAGTRWGDRLIVAGGVSDGIALVWLVAVFFSSVTLMQWLLCYLLLIAWCLALVGTASLIARFGNEIVTAAIVVVLGMLWLTCPIWSHGERVASLVVPVHPLFAINGVLQQLGMWTERPIAYRYLLTLGQDVPYELPHSILPCTAVHLLIGFVTFPFGWSRQR